MKRQLFRYVLCMWVGLLLTACSSTDDTSSVAYVPPYYSSMYYDPFWYYDDAYWYYYHPYCCRQGIDKDDVKDWWNDLDSDQQQKIKDKVDGWSDNDLSADLDQFKQKVNTEWNKLTPEQQHNVQHQADTYQKDWNALTPEKQQEITNKKKEYHQKWASMLAEQKQSMVQQWYGRYSGTKAAGQRHNIGDGSVKQKIQQHRSNPPVRAPSPSIGAGRVGGGGVPRRQ